MTDKQRDILQERLKMLDKAAALIFKARKPFDEALAEINAVRDSMLAEAGVKELEICEACERHLFVGDVGYRCADGPVLCESCAPTWKDLKDQYQQGLGLGADVEDLCHDSLTIDTIDAHIAAGDGDKKHVWSL